MQRVIENVEPILDISYAVLGLTIGVAVILVLTLLVMVTLYFSRDRKIEEFRKATHSPA